MMHLLQLGAVVLNQNPKGTSSSYAVDKYMMQAALLENKQMQCNGHIELIQTWRDYSKIRSRMPNNTGTHHAFKRIACPTNTTQRMAWWVMIRSSA